MTDTAPAAPTQTVVVGTSASPRWLSYAGLAGTAITLAGVLVATGQWREKTDNLEQRLGIVETVQRTNLPAFYGMQADLKYLAERERERARRADEAAAREDRR